MTLKHPLTFVPFRKPTNQRRVAAGVIVDWYLGNMAFIAPPPNVATFEPLYPDYSHQKKKKTYIEPKRIRTFKISRFKVDIFMN